MEVPDRDFGGERHIPCVFVVVWGDLEVDVGDGPVEMFVLAVKMGVFGDGFVVVFDADRQESPCWVIWCR